MEKTINAKNIISTSGRYTKGWNPFITQQYMNLEEILEHFEEKFKIVWEKIYEIQGKIEKKIQENTKAIEYAKENTYVIEDIENEMINSFSCFGKAKNFMEEMMKKNKPIKLNEKMLKAIQEECED